MSRAQRAIAAAGDAAGHVLALEHDFQHGRAADFSASWSSSGSARASPAMNCHAIFARSLVLAAMITSRRGCWSVTPRRCANASPADNVTLPAPRATDSSAMSVPFASAPRMNRFWNTSRTHSIASSVSITLRMLSRSSVRILRVPCWTSRTLTSFRLDPRIHPAMYPTMSWLSVNPSGMRGAWAGEIGQTPFLMSRYHANGTVSDGDGRVDLKRSVPNVFASTASVLQAGRCRRGAPWGPGHPQLPRHRALEPDGRLRARYRGARPRACR